MSNSINITGPVLSGGKYNSNSSAFTNDRNIVMNAVNTGLTVASVNFTVSGTSNSETMIRWGMSSTASATTPPATFKQGINSWHTPSKATRNLKFFSNTHLQLNNSATGFVRYEITVGSNQPIAVTDRTYVLHIATNSTITIKTVYN